MPYCCKCGVQGRTTFIRELQDAFCVKCYEEKLNTLVNCYNCKKVYYKEKMFLTKDGINIVCFNCIADGEYREN